MNQVQRKRARRFANFLLKVPKEQFNIDYVCYSTKENRRPVTKLGDCGSVACAMGHLPLFNPRRFVYKQWVERPTAVEYDIRDVVTGSINIRNHATEYFGFTENECRWLFFPDGYGYSSYVTPEDVANRILGILDKKPSVLRKLREFK